MNPTREKAIIIGLSGNQSYTTEALASGMDSFMIKPTASAEILQKVRTFLTQELIVSLSRFSNIQLVGIYLQVKL